jgi:hypothetical protein
MGGAYAEAGGTGREARGIRGCLGGAGTTSIGAFSFAGNGCSALGRGGGISFVRGGRGVWFSGEGIAARGVKRRSISMPERGAMILPVSNKSRSELCAE